jgi:hypothetical protein
MKLLLASLVVLVGCGASGINQSKAIFGAEAECPAADVSAEELSANVYVISGCGYKQVFSCLDTNQAGQFHWKSDSCQPTGERRSIGGSPPPKRAKNAKPSSSSEASSAEDRNNPFARGKIVQYTDADDVISPVTIDLVEGNQASIKLRDGKHIWVPLTSLSPPE